MVSRPVVTEGIELIKRFEGLHDGDKTTPILEPQRDPVGIWTLGYGSIRDLSGKRVTRDTRPITLDEAELLLRRDVHRAARGVDKYTDVWLPDLSYAAIVSFTYNLGVARYRASTLRQRINSGNWGDVPHQLSRWVRAGGRVLPGLVARRSAEGEMFIKGVLQDGYIIKQEGVYRRASIVSSFKRGAGRAVLEVA